MSEHGSSVEGWPGCRDRRRACGGRGCRGGYVGDTAIYSPVNPGGCYQGINQDQGIMNEVTANQDAGTTATLAGTREPEREMPGCPGG